MAHLGLFLASFICLPHDLCDNFVLLKLTSKKIKIILCRQHFSLRQKLINATIE